MKNCATCGAVDAPHKVGPLAGEFVAGVGSGRWVILYYCSDRCIFEGGNRHAEALNTSHTMAVERDAMEVCETEEQAQQLAR